jgi:hypothetical protein
MLKGHGIDPLKDILIGQSTSPDEAFTPRFGLFMMQLNRSLHPCAHHF